MAAVAKRKDARKKPERKRRLTGATTSGGMSAKKRAGLASTQFAVPKERKEPLNDAKHVRNAIARFNQVQGVSDKKRDKAWARIKRAAKKFGIDLTAKSWRELD